MGQGISGCVVMWSRLGRAFLPHLKSEMRGTRHPVSQTGARNEREGQNETSQRITKRKANAAGRGGVIDGNDWIGAGAGNCSGHAATTGQTGIDADDDRV